MPCFWMTVRFFVLRRRWTASYIQLCMYCPYMGALMAVMIVVAVFLAKWQTARLIKPINELNLEEPLENPVYEELLPFLEAMDKQNKKKKQLPI